MITTAGQVSGQNHWSKSQVKHRESDQVFVYADVINITYHFAHAQQQQQTF